MITKSLNGSLSGKSSSGFDQMLTKLQETFSSRHNMDYATDIVTILRHKNLLEAYNDILFEDYAETSIISESTECGNAGRTLHDTNYKNLQLLAEESRKELLSEASASGSLKPIVGLTLPLLKLYWIKNVYKDLLPVKTADAPTVILGIDRPYIMNPDTREKHYLPDAFMEHGLSLFDAARQKLTTAPITVPNIGFDLIGASGGSVKQEDQISKLFFISEIVYTTENPTLVAEAIAKAGTKLDEGQNLIQNVPLTEVKNETANTPAAGATTADITLSNLRIKAEQGHGIIRYEIKEGNKIVDILQGDIDFESGMLNVSSYGKIKSIKVDGYLSSENHLRTMSTGRDREDIHFDIPDAIHLATSLTEERIRDEKVIYNIDSTSYNLNLMVDSLAQYKDMFIKDFLDKSRERIRGSKLFYGTTFDCKPPSQQITPKQWVKEELVETLDRLAIKLTKILKNENMMLVVIGAQETVRLLDNVAWMYGKDSEVGGCKLGYSIGLYNNMRNFLIASTDRMTGNNDADTLQVLAIPLDESYMTYKLFEWQFVISNEYREASNPRLKSVMCFDRFLIDEYIPIQGEIIVNNNMISSSEIYN